MTRAVWDELSTPIVEWRHTYRSARLDGDRRARALRKWAREVFIGWPRTWVRFDRHGCRRGDGCRFRR